MKDMIILIQPCALCVGIYSNKSPVRKLLHLISQHLYFCYSSLVPYVGSFFGFSSLFSEESQTSLHIIVLRGSCCQLHPPLSRATLR